MLAFFQSEPVRRNRVILLGSAFVVIAGFLFAARGATFPFILGAALAYLLLPIVRFLETKFPFSKVSKKRSRLLAVISVYCVIFVAMFFTVSFIVPATIRQVTTFVTLLPDTISQAQQTFHVITEEYQARVPPELRERADEVVGRISTQVTDAFQQAALQSVLMVTQTFSILLGLAVVPVWLFYVLKDEGSGKQWLSEVVSSYLKEDATAIVRIVDRVLASYLRAQLFLGLVVGVLTWIGLTALGVKFSLVLAIIAGITELIPVLGPILGSIPGILVTLANAPDRLVWVVLFYIVVQQAENNLLVPRVQGSAVNIHPALLMMLLVLASEVAGFWGMLFIVPLSAVSREVFLYLYSRFAVKGMR